MGMRFFVLLAVLNMDTRSQIYNKGARKNTSFCMEPPRLTRFFTVHAEIIHLQFINRQQDWCNLLKRNMTNNTFNKALGEEMNKK